MLRSEKFADTARADLHPQRARPRTMSCWAIFWRKPVRRALSLPFMVRSRWRSGQGTHCCSRQRRCMEPFKRGRSPICL